MKLQLSNIDFSSIMHLEKTLSLLNPISTFGSLNAIFTFSQEKSEVGIILQDPTSIVKITLPVGLSASLEEEELPSLVGTYIDFNKFMYTLNQYSNDQRNELVITLIQSGETSEFIISLNKDRLSLPNFKIENKRIEEKEALLVFDWKDYHSFSSTTNKEQCQCLYSAIEKSSSFFGKDENKNNAASLYSNMLIVNDVRHVFIQSANFATDLTSFIPIHKKNLKLYYESLDTEKPYEMRINKEKDKMIIIAQGFIGLFSNAMSNAVPPSQEDLLTIKPDVRIATIKASVLLDAIKFFSGYYTSSSEFKVLGIEIVKGTQDFKFFLRDSGVSGFGACSIEKTIQVSNTFTNDETALIIYDSIKDFLAKESPDSDIEVYIDEKRAVYLKGVSQIYIQKFII